MVKGRKRRFEEDGRLGVCQKEFLPMCPQESFLSHPTHQDLRSLRNQRGWVGSRCGCGLEGCLSCQRVKTFDFVYYTGDIVSHRIWSTSIENNTRDITLISNSFREFFTVPVYPALGNHEPHPVNAVFEPVSNIPRQYPSLPK
ncbi:hypothetical protein NQ318_021880 [Aromia moschata]|uniref:Calcineurin-like phosphoesterase domain-containing protein n=1 Tax=Aromia moschata TaxID=1265417 RepID=A0AAV8Z6H8_9CUCU|nr:hypothetical protein NQ318_021880 [Aromia moschata]